MAVAADHEEEKMMISTGYMFMPTDQELLVDFLGNYASGHQLPSNTIKEHKVYSAEPWKLPRDLFRNGVKVLNDKVYYFTRVTRITLTSTRLARAAGKGFWHMNGKPETIRDSSNIRKLGQKVALKYIQQVGETKVGTKWIMHEYRLDESMKHKNLKEEMVLCVIQKSGRGEEEVIDDDPQESPAPPPPPAAANNIDTPSKKRKPEGGAGKGGGQQQQQQAAPFIASGGGSSSRCGGGVATAGPSQRPPTFQVYRNTNAVLIPAAGAVTHLEFHRQGVVPRMAMCSSHPRQLYMNPNGAANPYNNAGVNMPMHHYSSQSVPRQLQTQIRASYNNIAEPHYSYNNVGGDLISFPIDMTSGTRSGYGGLDYGGDTGMCPGNHGVDPMSALLGAGIRQFTRSMSSQHSSTATTAAAAATADVPGGS